MPKFVVKSVEEPKLCCFFCEVEIIRDSEEHDICHITEDGELCCQECLSCCDCENCEKKERFNEFKTLWDNLDGEETLSKEILQKLKSLDIEEVNELFKTQEELEEEEQKLQTLTQDELYDFINIQHHM